jgi:hypothetical protein
MAKCQNCADLEEGLVTVSREVARLHDLNDRMLKDIEVKMRDLAETYANAAGRMVSTAYQAGKVGMDVEEVIELTQKELRKAITAGKAGG